MSNLNHWPSNRQSQSDILAQMDELAQNDVAWFALKNLTASYFGGDDVAEIAKEAFCRHIGDNVLHKRGLHLSVDRYEHEVLEMVKSLFHAPPQSSGTITTGGSESIMLALKSARDRALALNPTMGTPEVLIPQSAYAVFNKSCQLLGIRIVQMDSSPNYRADVEGMRAAVNPNTIMMVGSAPPFPYGLVDPISELAAIAQENDIWFHVDACIGGFMLPFARDLGEAVPAFDFEVPGVTSMSCDFHKYGYAYRGCSVLLIRDKELEKYQGFESSNWPAGTYFSKNIVGSRNSGPVASAWAVMNYLGYEGYLELTRQIITSRQMFFEEITGVEGAYLLGQAEGPHFAFSVDDVDVLAVSNNLMSRGWRLNLGTKPDSILLMLSHHHGKIAQEFGRDLNTAVEEARSGIVHSQDDGVYGIY